MRSISAVASSALAAASLLSANAFSPAATVPQRPNSVHPPRIPAPLYSSPADTQPPPPTDEAAYDPPEDAIIQIKPPAMARLVELKQKRDDDPKSSVDPSTPLVLRMGVRNGGCSGLSYVMDFSTEDEIEEEDEVDTYEEEGIRCVVDAKSLLYLYGLELDYSDDLIGEGSSSSIQMPRRAAAAGAALACRDWFEMGRWRLVIGEKMRLEDGVCFYLGGLETEGEI